MATHTIAWTTGTGNITLDYSGVGSETVVVSSDPNNLSQDRLQVLTIKTTDNSVTKTVTITQKGKTAPPNYFCLTALDAGTFTLTIGADVTTSDLDYVEYSTNNGESWVKTNNVNSTEVVITTPSVAIGDKVYWRGSGTRMARGTTASSASVFSSTCNFNASGHIGSLLNVDTIANYSTISSNYAYTMLFYGSTKIKSAGNLLLPTTITQYCFNRMFMNCSNLVTSMDEIGAASVPAYCCNRMFYACGNLETTPAIMATGGSGNYILQYMFYNCAKVNYIKCLLLTRPSSSTFNNWVSGVASTGIFVKHINATWNNTGNSGVPTNWTTIYFDPSDNKYYTDQSKTQECDDHGNPI